MDIRNERGAVSGAEGCMFGAMLLFGLLLLGLLVVAFFRFQEPPRGPSMPGVGSRAPAADRVLSMPAAGRSQRTIGADV